MNRFKLTIHFLLVSLDVASILRLMKDSKANAVSNNAFMELILFTESNLRPPPGSNGANSLTIIK